MKVPPTCATLEGVGSLPGKAWNAANNGRTTSPISSGRRFNSQSFDTSRVASILKISTKTVVRRFEQFPGVINLGTEKTRRKRRYTVLRISGEVSQRFIVESHVQ